MADAHSQSQAISPVLHPVAVADLRPTQITVGMREVELKRHEWRALSPSKGPEFLGRHLVPVVRGPKDRPYVIDHHHLARALHEEGVKDVLVSFVADLRKLDKDAFWSFLDTRGWMQPFDSEWKRQPRTAIPKSVADLENDPYRSLAGELRFSGGYAKDVTPIQRIPVGRGLAPAHRQKGGARRLRRGAAPGSRIRQKRRGVFPAGLVRAA